MKEHWRIVIIPGMWSNQQTVQPIVKALDHLGIDIRVLELPRHANFNAGDLVLAKTSITSYREYVLEELKRLGESKQLILIGHSMGGLLAMAAAAELDSVQGLVLLAPGAPAGVCNLAPSLWSLGFGLLLHRCKLPFGLWEYPYRPNPWVARKVLLNGLPAKVQDAVIEGLTGESVRALDENSCAWFVAWANFQPSLPHPRKINFATIKCPILMVFGKEDRITPPKIAKGIEKLLRRAGFQNHLKLIFVPDTGHWLFKSYHWLEGWDKQPSLSTQMVDWITRITE